MIYENICPICDSEKLIVTGKRIQDKQDLHWSTEYQKLQKRIFFEIWHPSITKVMMKRCLCMKCGFVLDLPRPDKEDIRKKYEFLVIHEKYLGALKSNSNRVITIENNQSKKLLKMAMEYLGQSNSKFRILDYGGGDGHFLKYMKNANHKCFLIDYNKNNVNGIKNIGNTINDIKPSFFFDLIIIRHVLEHLADPKELLINMKNHLKKCGVIYAEVPIQLCGAAMPNSDPVTHINYFQERSLRLLFELAGYKTLKIMCEVSTYHGHAVYVAKIIARKGLNHKIMTENRSYKRSIKLIKTNRIICIIRNYWTHPIQIINYISKALERRIIKYL